MPSLQCPSCGRALNIPDNLRGSPVRCPLCSTTFQTPEETPPLVPEAPPTAAPSEAVPDGAGEASGQAEAFDFGESEQEAYGGVRVQAAVASAVGWLHLTLLFDFLSGLWVLGSLSLGAMVSGVWPLLLWGTVTVVFLYVPLVFVGVGANALRRRTSYGLALAGGIIALVVALMTLLATLWGVVVLLVLLSLGGERGGVSGAVYFVVWLAFTAFGTLSGVVGGIKTIAVLQKPEVRSALR